MLPLVWRITRALVLGAVAAAGISSAPDPEDPAAPEPTPPGLVQIHVAHSLGRGEAHRRIEKLVVYWGRFGIHGEWDGDSAQITGAPLGFEVKADVHVDEDSVDGTVKDPGPLFRDRAIGYVQWKVERYLDPQTPFEALP